MSCLPNLNKIAGQHSERWGALGSEIRRVDLILNTAPEEIPDKCKTLCESILKSILIDQKLKTEEDTEAINMEGLKALVLEHLPLEETDKSIIRAQIDFIVTRRNNSGVGGHGRSIQRQSQLRSEVCTRDVEYVLAITDSLTSFIVDFFEEKFPVKNDSERFGLYDEFLDSTYEIVNIEGNEFSPSEIMFYANPAGYKKAAQDFINEWSENNES